MKKLFYLGVLFLLAGSIEAMQSPKVEAVAVVEEQELQDAKAIAREAGKRMVDIRGEGKLQSMDVTLPNGKKVRQTNADLEASRYIMEQFALIYPTYGLISQDHMDQDGKWYSKESVWLINSIDGTKEFEKGNTDFHVQIGLLRGNEVVLGVSYYPATDTYVWAAKGQGAWAESRNSKRKLSVIRSHEKVIIESSSHGIIQQLFPKWNWTPDRVDPAPYSSTTRLLQLMDGNATLYISLGASPLGTEKKGGVWNYGANVIIAQEAGLLLSTLDGKPLNLREPTGLLTGGVVITTDPELFKTITTFSQ